jgi:shikimate kinase
MENLILLGYKSSGKTFYGKLLAQTLGAAFIDTDQLIEKKYQNAFHEKYHCKQISLILGEEEFRNLEKTVIKDLKGRTNTIIALGGGAILLPENCSILEKLGKLVYLKTDKETIKQRVFNEGIPSFLDPNDPEGSFEKMYKEREPIYENIGEVIVNVQGKTDQQVLKELMNL